MCRVDRSRHADVDQDIATVERGGSAEGLLRYTATVDADGVIISLFAQLKALAADSSFTYRLRQQTRRRRQSTRTCVESSVIMVRAKYMCSERLPRTRSDIYGLSATPSASLCA